MTTGLARKGGAPFTGIVEDAYTSELTKGRRARVKVQRTFAGKIQGPGDDLAPVSEGLCMKSECGQ